ncbi:hypothetical protein J2T17_007808 [Paenibacillus mucilaginosus]|uniref:hypothetical protein n=1 Tax=Paenibacillus mucilaginosus TaxID=61624 RepID=UPI003D1EB4DD
MSAFKKELIKVSVTIAIGLGLFIFMLINAHAGDTPTKPIAKDEIPFIVTMILYPTGVLYGWRDMLRLFSRGIATDRAHEFTYVSQKTMQISAFIFFLSLLIALSVGWIAGIYRAVRTLIYLRNAS